MAARQARAPAGAKILKSIDYAENPLKRRAEMNDDVPDLFCTGQVRRPPSGGFRASVGPVGLRESGGVGSGAVGETWVLGVTMPASTKASTD